VWEWRGREGGGVGGGVGGGKCALICIHKLSLSPLRQFGNNKRGKLGRKGLGEIKRRRKNVVSYTIQKALKKECT